MNKKQVTLTLVASLAISIAGIGVHHAPGSVQSAQSPDLAKDTTIFVAGDVMLARSVNAQIQAHHDPNWPFIYVHSVVSGADLAIGNLETPLIANCPVTREGMIFCGGAANASGLAYAGFDVLSLANNHTANYGPTGLAETEAALTRYGVGYFGTGSAVFREVHGVRFALLGYNDVTRQVDEGEIAAEVTAARAQADVVIVYFHWGQEYKVVHNARQAELAHLVVDAGADIVLGAHPHVVEDHEVYRGKPIYYSLGNFVFDQEWSPATKEGLALELTFHGTHLSGVKEIPVFLENYGQVSINDIL